MSGYTPVFRSVVTGSLFGKYPEMPVWLMFLALQERGGIVDVTPDYMAQALGIPVEDVERAIASFLAPDPRSRTPQANGRRIEALPNRGFGWRILNHELYQDKARWAARQAEETRSGRDAERKRRERATAEVQPTPDVSAPVRSCPHESAPVRLSDSDSDSNINPKKGEKKSRARALPPISEFDLTLSRKAYADKTLPNVDADELFAAFRDHHASKGSVFKDWDAAWRTYVRNGLKFGYPTLKTQPEPKTITRYDVRGRVIQ